MIGIFCRRCLNSLRTRLKNDLLELHTITRDQRKFIGKAEAAKSPGFVEGHSTKGNHISFGLI
jgi:hypothetical protein